MLEIERKFLVKNDQFKQESFQYFKITQGYLNSHPERTVRIRIKEPQAFLTIKGKSSESGLSRLEWEKEIEVEEAKKLLPLCEPGVIEKTRFLVKAGDHVVEVDEFYGENTGLLLAEIELSSENEHVVLPSWIGEEVTGNKKYYNSALVLNPYKNW